MRWAAAPMFEDAESSESPFTWSVAPRFEINDNLSVFARVATGFRPGGPNVIPVDAPPGTPGSYDSDELTNYELGFRADSPSGRFALDVTAYFLDWEDVQLFAQMNGVGLNANGGTAESKGVEFAVTAQTDRRLDPVLQRRVHGRIPYRGYGSARRRPRWRSAAVCARVELRGRRQLRVAGDGGCACVRRRKRGIRRRPARRLQQPRAGRQRPRSRRLHDREARAGIDFGRWSIEIYGRNLSDEEGVNNILAEGMLPNGNVGLGLIRPRTYGLSLGASF